MKDTTEPEYSNDIEPEVPFESEVGLGESRFRISRLAKKELRETLRDRRTLITLILMPLLVYPILSLVFRTFLLNTAEMYVPPAANGFRFVVEGDAGFEKTTQIVEQIRAFVAMQEQQSAIREFENNDQNEGVSQKPPEESINEKAAVPNDPNEALLAAVADPEIRVAPQDMPFADHSWAFLESGEEQLSLEDNVAKGFADCGVRFRTEENGRGQLAKYEIVYDPLNPASKAAYAYLSRKILTVNQQVLLNVLRSRRVPAQPPLENTKVIKVESQYEEGKAGPNISMASLIPLILVLMTITGAVYPAIDLTAGERERGTLETLMAAPIPRMGILFSKFIAVLTVAILTASLNIIGMAVTIWAFQLDSFLGESGFTIGVCLKIFALLVLFASFYSAVLLAVTSYARSFKEAQSYLVPIILLSMAPGLMAMSPGLTLSGPLCITPMVNILLLGRDLLQQNVMPIPSLIAIVSTLLYTGLSIFAAARIFGTDAILYGSQATVNDTFKRPTQWKKLAPIGLVMLCLVLLFPINFLLIGVLGRFGADMTIRMVLMSVFTVGAFMVFPWVLAQHQRVETASAFGWRGTRFIYFVGAVLLGVSLWPIVMAIISGWHDVYGMLAGVEKSQEWHDRLVKFSSEQAVNFRKVSPALIAVSFSLVPAICEEWFFRGFLLRSLLSLKGKWTAIIGSAVIFGLFHVLSNSVVAMDRLAPTALVGIVLGYLSYKSGSILPGIIMHALHNGIIAFLSYYQPQLSQFDWFPAANEAIPTAWVMGAFVPAATGLLLIVLGKRVED